MNERIKELAEQAGFYSSEYGNAEESFIKFAELIVKECVKRIQGCHLAEGYDPSAVGEYEMGYKKGIDKAASQVLLHFGLTL